MSWSPANEPSQRDVGSVRAPPAIMSVTPTATTRRPLFVTGMERSGTTLLASILAQHPAIGHRVPPFTSNLFSHWPDGVRHPGELERFLDDLYGRTRFAVSPVHREVLRARLGPLLPLTFRDLAAEVMTAHSAHHGKPDFVYWVDKTPLFVTLLHENKARFDRVLGDYRMVSILRDGRAVLSSVLRAQATLGHGFRTDVFYLAAQWRRSATLGALFSRPGQHLQVRYEELITRPAATIETVCRFLDLPYESRMLDYWRSDTASPIHRLLSSPPRADRIEAWHTEADPRLLRVFDLLARPELARAHYAPLPPSLRRGLTGALGEAIAYWLDTRVRARVRRRLDRARSRSADGSPGAAPPRDRDT